MKMYPARLDRQGRMVVPREVRDAVGVNPGDVLFFLVAGGQVRVTRSPGSLEEYRSLFGGEPIDDADTGVRQSEGEEEEGDNG